MPRPLTPERRQRVIDDVIRRLDPIIASTSREPPTRVNLRVAAARALMGTDFPLEPGDLDQLQAATGELLAARGEPAGEGKVIEWVSRFCDPRSDRALPSLVCHWTRSVNLLRDQERRRRRDEPDTPFVTIRLDQQHQRMLADLRRAMPALSLARLVSESIKRQHQQLRDPRRKVAPAAPGLFDRLPDGRKAAG